jgi:putative oxidoreductase
MSRQNSTARATAAAGHGQAPGRGVHWALWVAQVLLALVFLAVSYPKVTLDPGAVEGFGAMGFSAAGTLIIGCLEVAGAIGLLVPRLSGLAALGLVALMIGATVATALTMGVASVLLPVVLGVVAALVAWGRWYRTVELTRSVRALAAR